MKNVKPPRTLIWISLFLMALLIVLTSITTREKLGPALTIDTKGQPTLGSKEAKIHLVLFEEPKCPNCRDFTLQVFPQLKKEFIDNNLIRFTSIPVSFLKNSSLAAEAYYAIYYNDPSQAPDAELAFDYLHTMYKEEPDESVDWVSIDSLIDYAEKTSDMISILKLKEALKSGKYSDIVKQNTQYAKDLMEGKLATPTLYINGRVANDMSFDEVARLIKLVQKKESEK